MKARINSPIVIGGIGGSGTRIIAKILIESGVYLGNDLNKANDNLVFTRLFKDPIWFRTTNQERVYGRLKLFEKYMTGQALSLIDFQTAFTSFRENHTYKTQKLYYLKFLLKHFLDKKSSRIWGWKEPNTHIYIKYIAQYFNNLKYIHVVRNGLDMAFSKNQQQLRNWGFLFDIDLLDSPQPLHYNQLSYWIESTKTALEIGRKFLGSQFYLLNYDKFCLDSSNEILKLMVFLDLEIDPKENKRLTALIKLPKTIGRAMNKDLSVFSDRQLKEVKKLGFDLSEYNF